MKFKFNENITQGQWLITIISILIWLVFSVGAFIYFKQQCSVAQQTPLKYVAEKYDLESCVCNRIDNDFFYFNRERAWIERKATQLPNSFNVNLSEVDTKGGGK